MGCLAGILGLLVRAGKYAGTLAVRGRLAVPRALAVLGGLGRGRGRLDLGLGGLIGGGLDLGLRLGRGGLSGDARGRDHELVGLEHGLVLSQHPASGRLGLDREAGRPDIRRQLPNMIFRVMAVQPGQRVVDTAEAKIGPDQGEPDRRLAEQRVKQCGVGSVQRGHARLRHRRIRAHRGHRCLMHRPAIGSSFLLPRRPYGPARRPYGPNGAMSAVPGTVTASGLAPVPRPFPLSSLDGHRHGGYSQQLFRQACHIPGTVAARWRYLVPVTAKSRAGRKGQNASRCASPSGHQAQHTDSARNYSGHCSVA